jgi:hypothetical protein
MTFLSPALALIASYTMFISAYNFQTKERLPLNGYAIQITYKDGKDGSFTHSYLTGQELKGKTSFTLPPWRIIKRADKDSEQVSMVLVAVAFEGAAWKIKVSVRKGEFYDKGDQEVATYSAHENERVTIKEIEQLGVEPFDVSIVKVIQNDANRPAIRNNTKSIEVTNFEATSVPAPYRISLRNLSNKPVLALEVNSYTEGKKQLMIWPQGAWDRPLIEPGGGYEVGISSEAPGRMTDYGYEPAQTSSIEVTTVVFEDGTYEGNPFLAAGIRGNMMGCKVQLGHALPLLKTALEATEGGRVGALLDMKERALALSEEVDASRLKELQDQFPSLDVNEKNILSNYIKWGMHHVKATLIKEIDSFEKGGQQTNSNQIREWLGKTKERYEKWLSAL